MATPRRPNGETLNQWRSLSAAAAWRWPRLKSSRRVWIVPRLSAPDLSCLIISRNSAAGRRCAGLTLGGSGHGHMAAIYFPARTYSTLRCSNLLYARALPTHSPVHGILGQWVQYRTFHPAQSRSSAVARCGAGPLIDNPCPSSTVFAPSIFPLLLLTQPQSPNGIFFYEPSFRRDTHPTRFS